MSRIGHWLVHQSVRHLIRLACFAALIALGLMAYSVVSLKPLPVIFAMSVGHGIGIFAFLCYLLAVILDTRRLAPVVSVPPPPPDPSREDSAVEETTKTANDDDGKDGKD